MRFLEESYLPELDLKMSAVSFLSQAMESSGTPQQLAEQFIEKRLETDTEMKKKYDTFMQTLPTEESDSMSTTTEATEEFKEEEELASDDSEQEDEATENSDSITSGISDDEDPVAERRNSLAEDLVMELRHEIATLKLELDTKNEIIRKNTREWEMVLAALKKTPVRSYNEEGQTQLAADASDLTVAVSDPTEKKITESLQWLREFRHVLHVHLDKVQNPTATAQS
ncbi:MAG: hypothetical protein P4L69_03360 [Desulfosporosinus sp.]|nr:hypothetical protein [Desulfosporosinus sp.]